MISTGGTKSAEAGSAELELDAVNDFSWLWGTGAVPYLSGPWPGWGFGQGAGIPAEEL